AGDCPHCRRPRSRIHGHLRRGEPRNRHEAARVHALARGARADVARPEEALLGLPAALGAGRGGPRPQAASRPRAALRPRQQGRGPVGQDRRADVAAVADVGAAAGGAEDGGALVTCSGAHTSFLPAVACYLGRPVAEPAAQPSRVLVRAYPSPGANAARWEADRAASLALRGVADSLPIRWLAGTPIRATQPCTSRDPRVERSQPAQHAERDAG